LAQGCIHFLCLINKEHLFAPINTSNQLLHISSPVRGWLDVVKHL
jgi:hypothetical protein